jgi:hypothetical protein
MPCKIDMNPSGWSVACATRDNVVSECAITVAGLSTIRQVVATRMPFVSSDGNSYSTHSPVSVIKVPMTNQAVFLMRLSYCWCIALIDGLTYP